MSGSERQAAVELFRRHHQALFRYVARFTGDGEAAEDIVQETFVRLLEKPPRSPEPLWLFRVATNLARDRARIRLRRQQLLLSASARLPHGDAPPTPDALLEQRERRQLVQAALLQLSERERTALLMTEEGFRQREIAEAVGTTTKSVGNLIARAARKLAARLPRTLEEA